MDVVGHTLGGRYRVLRVLGRGGMGVVYEAEQIDLARRVAIKVLLERDPRTIERFAQEAFATSRLKSPNVVTVLDFVKGGGHEPPFLVMELLDGPTLASRLAREGRLPTWEATAIATQMLAGLGAAHDAGIIHRDVKPTNVLVSRTREGRDLVKMLDFGIAKVLAPDAYQTTTGALAGTPAYMAPEQLRGEIVDARTDVYAVGLCLYEMLAGRRPWRSSGPVELSAEILRDDALPLGTVAPDVPSELAAIVSRALAKDRNARFANADALRSALEPWTQTRADDPTRRAPLAAPAASPSALAPTPRAATKPDGALPQSFETALKIVLGSALVLVVAAWIVSRIARSRSEDAPLAPAAVTTPAATAPPPPPPEIVSSAPTVAEVDGCVCVHDERLYDGTPCSTALCRHDDDKRCICVFRGVGRLGDDDDCRVRHVRGKCPPGMAIQGDKFESIDGCRYYVLAGGKDVTRVAPEGPLCGACVAQHPTRAAPNGPCGGVDEYGDERLGTWRCGDAGVIPPKTRACPRISHDRFGGL